MALVATVDRCVLCDFAGGGPKSSQPPEALSRFVLTDSGTSALILAISAAKAKIDITGEPEMIIPAYCCPDVLSAVRYCGAKPVLADMEEGTSCLSLDAVAAALNEKTVAIIAVNFLGIPERLDRLADLVDRYQCALIDDACQSPPALDEGTGRANYRIYSFGRGKPVSLLHGGAVLGIEDSDAARALLRNGPSPDAFVIERLRCRMFNLARHRLIFGFVHWLGFAGRTRYEEPVSPSTMSAHTAAILPAAIDAYSRRPRGIAVDLEAKLKNAGAEKILRLTETPGVDIAQLLRFPFFVPDQATRDRLIREIRQIGVCATALYERPLADIAGTNLDVAGADFPAALELSRKLLTVPLHSEISDAKVAKIANVLAAHLS